MAVIFVPRNLPNFITVVRFLLIAPIVACLLTNGYSWAFGLLVFAAISDGVDGFLARYYDWHSRLGTYLDPLADKALMTAVYFTLGWHGVLPMWLVTLVILRDAMILVGAFVIKETILATGAKPSLISKFNTVTQVLLALLAVWLEAVDSSWPLAINTLVVMVAVSTIASGLWYVMRGVN
jgi:cardiolipin synthase